MRVARALNRQHGYETRSCVDHIDVVAEQLPFRLHIVHTHQLVLMRRRILALQKIARDHDDADSAAKARELAHRMRRLDTLVSLVVMYICFLFSLYHFIFFFF